jgi:hypothetical protein
MSHPDISPLWTRYTRSTEWRPITDPITREYWPEYADEGRWVCSCGRKGRQWPPGAQGTVYSYGWHLTRMHGAPDPRELDEWR